MSADTTGDPTMTDASSPPVDEPTEAGGEEPIDTTNGQRDPLTTDDGLVAVAEEGMPEVEPRAVSPGQDAQEPYKRELLDNPDLDVDHDGNDPCAGQACNGQG